MTEQNNTKEWMVSDGKVLYTISEEMNEKLIKHGSVTKLIEHEIARRDKQWVMDVMLRQETNYVKKF